MLMEMHCGRLIFGMSLLALLIFSNPSSAQTPPNINQCRNAWTLTTVQEMNFGGFSIESGSGNIVMNSLGGLSTVGLVNLSTSIPATTWVLDINNTLDALCATYGFTIDWRRPPRPLRGPGTQIPFGNVLVSIPAYGLNGVSLPQTIPASAANTAPFTVTLYGEITVNSPQTAGEYSRRQVLEFTQSTRSRRTRADVTATSFVPLSISETLPMDFGTVAGGPSPGSVILDTSNGRIATGDAQLLSVGVGNSASFQVSGEPNQVYSIVYGDGTLASSGGQQITVTNFTDNSNGSIPGAGTETFQVGATLNLGPNQPAGSYSTSNGGGIPYTITINYN
ncbi:MAG: DUF4402 domain-containing protein [Pseudomonadota bacterium]